MGHESRKHLSKRAPERLAGAEQMAGRHHRESAVGEVQSHHQVVRQRPTSWAPIRHRLALQVHASHRRQRARAVRMNFPFLTRRPDPLVLDRLFEAEMRVVTLQHVVEALHPRVREQPRDVAGRYVSRRSEVIAELVALSASLTPQAKSEARARATQRGRG
jgi:hypothetical protein